MSLRFIAVVFLWTLAHFLQAEGDNSVTFSHAISLYGTPQYGADMKHFDFVNPDAPKGGTLNVAQIGSFDTFNAYGPNGKVPFGLTYTNETLMMRGWDEPLSKYGAVAEKVESPEDNSWVAFHINPKAHFHDGKAITADDVVFSFTTITEKGSLFWRQFYQDVDTVEATSPQRVLFTFKHNQNRELPLLLGQLPVLASHWWQNRDFSETTLDIPIGSGPYKIHRFQPGRFVEYKRDPNYWAKDIPTNIGRYNFDIVRYDFFRDNHITVEAINSGQLNWQLESDPRFWEKGYSQRALDKGKLVKSTWVNHNPQTDSLVFNTRKPLFSDVRVREAIATLFDIDWVLSNLLNNTSERATSLFAGSELAAAGLPNSEELALLTPLKDHLPQRVFTHQWPPFTGMKKREKLKHALNLFQQAGFLLVNGKIMQADGQPVIVEMLLGDPSLERLMQGQVQRLAEAGIEMRLRTVESARYLKHIRELDFDIILHSFRHTPSPGQEQMSFWGSEGSDQPGTLNFAGVNNPAIDNLVHRIPSAKTWPELVTLVHALDRSLLWDFKVVPLFYNSSWRVIHSSNIKHPERLPKFSLERATWWAEPH
ncbi:extracellular solute-binding protein [Sansalvadorimonas verongulae]|uniref:extracellular solute-binding protein n=1 Tax=Sansalvadorimonas verongulae TaxID=2172824 RepID=UPI0012BD0CC6|nr:extracellular solute-binding protein [Sansalvadorimonas verongulae]MTI14654.1 ABC transporter substrate-binding protein [Sansalvadorimonas verongulae]